MSVSHMEKQKFSSAHSRLTQYWGERSRSHRAHFVWVKRTSTHCTEGWAGPKASLHNWCDYSGVSVYDSSFYDPHQTEHSRRVVLYITVSTQTSFLYWCTSSSFPVCTFFFYFSAVISSWMWFFHPTVTSIKKTDCPLLQNGVKRTRKV
jgi:hypothetical protein